MSYETLECSIFSIGLGRNYLGTCVRHSLASV